MAFTPNLEDRERDKFVESPTRPGYTAVEVVDSQLATAVVALSIKLDEIIELLSGEVGNFFTDVSGNKLTDQLGNKLTEL